MNQPWQGAGGSFQPGQVPPPYAEPAPIAAFGDRSGSFWRRVGAWGVDFGLVAGVFCFVMVSAGHAVLLDLRNWWRIGGQALSMVFWSADGVSVERAAVETWQGVAFPLVLALCFVVVVQFLYQFGALAWRGRTLGKVMLDLQVRGADGVRRVSVPGAFRRAALTTLGEFGLFSVALILLIEVQVGAAQVVLWVGIVLFWFNLVPMVAPGRRSVGDLVGGTRVVRTRTYRAAARGAVDAAAAGRQMLQDGGRGVLESERGRQAVALGQVGLDRGREVGRAGLLKGRAAGREARRLWQERRAQRQQPPAPPYPGSYPPPGYPPQPSYPPPAGHSPYPPAGGYSPQPPYRPPYSPDRYPQGPDQG